MTDKIECPACEANDFAFVSEFREGGPCPYCGLPNDAIGEVFRARKAHADEQLIKKYTEAVQRAERAEEQLAYIQRQAEEAKSCLDVASREWST